MAMIEVLSELEQKVKDFALDALAQDVQPGENPAFLYGKAQGVVQGMRIAIGIITQHLEEEEQKDV